MAASRRELRPAQPADAHAGVDRAQLAQECARVQISGRLAAREQKARAQELGRLKS
jgi:hypothetical protein